MTRQVSISLVMPVDNQKTSSGSKMASCTNTLINETDDTINLQIAIPIGYTGNDPIVMTLRECAVNQTNIT